MEFKKGRKKTGERNAGTTNKAAQELREQLTGLVQTTLNALPQLPTTMDFTDRARPLTTVRNAQTKQR